MFRAKSVAHFFGQLDAADSPTAFYVEPHRHEREEFKGSSPVGLEQGAKSSGKCHFCLYTSAKSDALSASAENQAIFAVFATDPELAEIAATWANQSPTISDSVIILIRAMRT